MTTCGSGAALLLATTALLSGQTPPRFRATTRLVQVNVIVSDKSGPVEGLSKEDFVLYDDGKKQDIAVFKSYGRWEAQVAAPALAPAPDEFTNALGNSGSGVGVGPVVWDLESLKLERSRASCSCDGSARSSIRYPTGKAITYGYANYTLAFYPQHSEKESKPYHALKLTVNRRGVTTRYPKTYQTYPDDVPPERMLASALAGNLDFNELRITARLEHSGSALRVPISIGPQGALLRAAASDRWTAQFDYAVVQQAGDRSALDGVWRTLTLNPNATEREIFLKQGFHLIETLTPQSGLAAIKILVLDRNSGSVGSLTIPIKP